MTHPITQTLQRGLQRRHGGCHLGLQTGARGQGWAPIATLAADPHLLRALLNPIGGDIGSDRRDVQASILLESYTWRLVLPLAGALVAEQRVALPSAHDVELRPSSAAMVELRMSPGRFVTMPDDAASMHRDATVAATPSALIEHFAGMLVEHFAIIIDALRTIALRAERALWRTVCDRIAMALLHAGLACGTRDRAEAIAHEVLGGSPPLVSPPAYVNLRIDERTHRAHLRRGCCLWWRTAAGGYCATCPLRRRTGRPPA